MRPRTSAATLLLCLAAALPAAGQAAVAECVERAVIDVPDPFSLRFDAARILQLTGAAPHSSMMLRRVSAESGTVVCAERARSLAWAVAAQRAAADADVAWGLVPPTVHLNHNSAIPRDRNNGALWAGVGTNFTATAGVRARWRWFDLQLAPQVISEANADFTIVPVVSPTLSEFTNRYHAGGIDWYQRPGTEAQSRIDPGQSFIRATVGPVSAGFGTENVWLGPARIYPVLMSATAGGFPHAFLETSSPVRTPIGGLEARVLWGQLAESEWFDVKPDNDDRIFAALLLTYSPRWIPGFSIGGARVYHETLPPGEFDIAHVIGTAIDPSFLGSGGGNRAEGNGLAGIFGRFALPSAGFEVYGEWTREDTPWDMQDVLAEPDWTQAYALGFQHYIGSPTDPRGVRWYGELIHLGESAPLRAGRGLFSYYTHSMPPQGHTQEGQLMGAWIGPGSDAQILGADFLYGRGLSGVWIERNRFDDDTYYRRFADRFGETRHDVELVLGARQLYRFPMGVELDGSLSYGTRFNRMFIAIDSPDRGDRTEHSLSLDLRARWFPPVRLP